MTEPIYNLLNEDIRAERAVALATVIEGPEERVGRLRRGGRVVVPRRLKDGVAATAPAGKAGAVKPGEKAAPKTASGKTPVPTKSTARDAEAPAKGKRQREKFE